MFLLAFDVVHVADRRDVEVASGFDREVFAGGGAAADDVDVLPRFHRQVAARCDAGGEVFDVGGDAGFFAAVTNLVFDAGVAGGDQVEVAAGAQGGVVAGYQCASVGEVAAGVHGEVFAGDDGAGAGVGEGAHARAVTHLDGGGVVGDVAFECGEADLLAANFAGHGVADAVVGQQAQVVAGFHEAAGVKAAATAGGGEVVAGAQGADVDEVAASDQVEVAALDQAVAAHIARFGLGQVKHGHEDGLAVDHAVSPHTMSWVRASLLASALSIR